MYFLGETRIYITNYIVVTYQDKKIVGGYQDTLSLAYKIKFFNTHQTICLYVGFFN